MEYLINAIEADKPTVNGRTYSRKAIENAVAQAKENIAKGRCFITYDTKTPEIDLGKIAGKVNDIYMENDKMKISFECLDTMPMGNILRHMISNVDIYPCCIGSVTPDGKVSEEDLRLISFNFIEKNIDSNIPEN